MGKLDETMERIKKARAEQGALIAQLERSLALKALWPEAFTAGRCRAWVEGCHSTGWRYIAERVDGERREWAAQNVEPGRQKLAEIALTLKRKRDFRGAVRLEHLIEEGRNAGA